MNINKDILRQVGLILGDGEDLKVGDNRIVFWFADDKFENDAVFLYIRGYEITYRVTEQSTDVRYYKNGLRTWYPCTYSIQHLINPFLYLEAKEEFEYHCLPHIVMSLMLDGVADTEGEAFSFYTVVSGEIPFETIA